MVGPVTRCHGTALAENELGRGGLALSFEARFVANVFVFGALRKNCAIIQAQGSPDGTASTQPDPMCIEI
jgi:hypothetical protein